MFNIAILNVQYFADLAVTFQCTWLSLFDYSERHATEFRPINTAAHSKSYDNTQVQHTSIYRKLKIL